MIVGRCGGTINVVGIGEARQCGRFDREAVEAEMGITALFKNRLRHVLVGPLPEELATAPKIWHERQCQSEARGPMIGADTGSTGAGGRTHSIAPIRRQTRGFCRSRR